MRILGNYKGLIADQGTCFQVISPLAGLTRLIIIRPDAMLGARQNGSLVVGEYVV